MSCDVVRSGACAVVIGLFAFSIPAYAERDLFSLSLEELMLVEVQAPSRYQQPISQAPGITSVLTRKDIQSFGARDLTDIINRLPGAMILTGYVFSDNALSIRGDLPNQNDNHVLFLINGRPFRGGYSAPMLGVLQHAFPIETIERIEYVRGPGSVLYGSNAYSGVINIITRDVEQNEGSISFAAGSFDTQLASATLANKGDELDFQVAVRSFTSDGERLAMTDEVNVTSAADFHQRDISLFANASYRNWDVDLFLATTDETHFGSIPRWPVQDIDRDVYFIGVGHEMPLQSGWTLFSNFSFNHSTQYYPSGPTVAFDGKGDEAGFEMYAVGKVIQDGMLTLGGSVNLLDGEIAGGGSVALPDYSVTWSSLYGQLDYKFSPNLNGFIGGQWNKAENISAEFVPRLGAIYQIDESRGIKALYSEAFRSPYPAETDVQALPVLTGNPSLEPELVKTVDLQYFSSRRIYQYSLGAFFTRQSDLITRTAPMLGQPGTFINRNELEIKGVEAEWRIIPNPDWDILGSILYQENESGQGVEDITLMPDYIFKLGVAYHPSRLFSVGLFDTYIDDFKSVSVINPGVARVNPDADGYHLLTLNVRLGLSAIIGEAGRGAELYLYGNNLLDEEIHVPEYSRGFINTLPASEGRSFMAGVKLSF